MSPLKDLSLLYVDDDAYFRKWMHDCLNNHFGNIFLAKDGLEALELFSSRKPDMVLTDVYMPGMDGMSLAERLREISQATPVVLHTAFTDVPLLIRGIELGVAGFVQKPPNVMQLVDTLERAAIPVLQRRKLEHLEKELLLSMEHILGQGEALRAIGRQVCRVAATDYPILICGETGTGKSRLARIVHDMSRRSKGPFVTVQLGSLPEGLIAAELFGHEKGAFTGAEQKRQGMVAAASGGTLFLDDVDAAPIMVQALLLQLAESKTFCRLGSSRPIQSNTRIIAASNRDLAADAEAGLFRRDLYYRLAGLLIDLPPLRETLEDLPDLAEKFLVETCDELNRRQPALQTDGMSALLAYSWPGNIRELRNVIKRTVVLADKAITPEIVAAALGGKKAEEVPQPKALRQPASQVSHDELPLRMAAVEKWALQRALMAAGGKKMVAARLLDMNYYTFRRHLVLHGLQLEEDS